MINFPKTLSVDACEKINFEINADPDESLQLPVDTTGYAFGAISSAIQSLITWGRRSENRFLYLRESTSVDVLDDAVLRPHKLVACMFAKTIICEDVDVRSGINLKAKGAIEKQSVSSFGMQHGRLCWFAFVDHSTKGFDRNFYIDSKQSKPEPRSSEQIASIIKSMIDKSMLVAGGAKHLSGDNSEYLGRIFYELFINTHEHGSRSEKRSVWLKPGVRTIYTYGINLDEAGAEDNLKEIPVLTSYLGSVLNIQGVAVRRRYVEISINDSGLGYAKRWLVDRDRGGLEKELSLSGEYDAFQKCFRFRNTSTNFEHKGHGLHAVMERLTRLNGFLKVRSGRLSLYRDFVNNPYVEDDACEFYDWNTLRAGTDHLTEMSPVEGVSITLLIPLEAKS